MADQARTIPDLLTNLFQDGQPDGSINEQDMRDLIMSFTPALGGMYMESNATATTIAIISTWYKVAGSTIAYSDLFDFTMPANNRLTYGNSIDRHMKLHGAFTITSGTNNQTGEISLYQNGVIIPGSTSEFKCIASGDPISVPMVAQFDMSNNDYFESYIKNESGANDMTVSYMNLSVDGVVHA